MIKIAYRAEYVAKLPEGHRFPMMKYELIPQQLKYEGVFTEDHFFEPGLIDEKSVLQVHDKQYWRDLKELTLDPKAARKIGFPLTKELVEREMFILEGTRRNALYAMENGVSFNVAGGTHHAFSDRGEGFCLLNDIAVSARWMLDNGHAKRILVVDLDVHQGNGTAELFMGEDRVYTLSVHGEKNYPLRKEISDLDIGLPDLCEDEQYLDIVSQQVLRKIKEWAPDMVYYQSGVDILESDKLGRLGVTMEGCKTRDQLVFETCFQEGIPVVVTMGGGYTPRVSVIVDAHVNTFKVAREIYEH